MRKGNVTPSDKEVIWPGNQLSDGSRDAAGFGVATADCPLSGGVCWHPISPSDRATNAIGLMMLCMCVVERPRTKLSDLAHGARGWQPRWPAAAHGRLFHTPLMLNKTLTAQDDSSDPRVTGSNVAANAHHSIIPNWQRFRASTKIMPPAKQIAGVTVTVSIHNKGVADQSLLNPLVAK